MSVPSQRHLALGPAATAFGAGSVEIGCFIIAVAVAAFAFTRHRIIDVKLTGAPAPQLTH